MSPIRVGLIGLSTSTNPWAPGMWATTAHLPSILASPHYELVALCNSTIASAKASIAHHNLGPNIKAYGSPEDLAQDPKVDLVVVSVGVGKHYMLTKPALRAGKDVLVEWPLCVNTAEAKELADLAQAKGVKTIMGLQARASPLVSKIKQVINNGRIGKVLSTTAVSICGLPVDKFPADGAYYMNKDSGGNVMTVQLGHFLDTLTSILGEPLSLSPLLATQYPTIALLSPSGHITNPAHRKTAPDHMTIHGTLRPNPIIFSVTFRSPPFGTVDSHGLRWIITGTEGEMEILTPELQWQFVPEGTVVRVKSKGRDGVEKVKWEDEGEERYVKEVDFPGTNTARLYEAFARGERGGYADFGDAVVRHEMLDQIAGKT